MSARACLCGGGGGGGKMRCLRRVFHEIDCRKRYRWAPVAVDVFTIEL